MDEHKILADAIKTIGRSMPVGMEVFFFRDEGSDGAGMTITMPDGKSTEYRFLHSNPLPSFAVSLLAREMKIEQALADLLASIELHTDCMSGQIDREAIDPWIEPAEALLGLEWTADETHPANRIDHQPATVSYPTGSLGEAVEDSA